MEKDDDAVRIKTLKTLTDVVKRYLKKYKPATFKACDVHFTTEEIYHQLQSIYPSPIYWQSDVTDLLVSNGYSCEDIAAGRMEWPMTHRAS